MRNRQWSLILIFALSGHVFALPKHQATPGGIAVLAIAPSQSPQPEIYFQDKPVTVVKSPDGIDWLAIVGLPLSMQKGRHELTVRNPVTGKRFQHWIDVTAKKYRTQRLTIRNKSKVNPNNKQIQRILREQKVKRRLQHYRSNHPVKLDFQRPIKGRHSGRFGARRILNGQTRSPHSGEDIAAPTGTPIKAPSPAKVLHVDDFYFTGKVVYLDHGQGVISLYAHLSQATVRPGQWVNTGDIIGKVGSTGRSTGPHLHWSIYLNGVAVDPTLFF